jgi:hypothetical protein
MGFSVFVEMLNLRLKKASAHTVRLNEPLSMPEVVPASS